MGNKGTFGKVLLVAGSKGMCGAACLSASAALHGGAGMVRSRLWKRTDSLQSLLPDGNADQRNLMRKPIRKSLNW